MINGETGGAGVNDAPKPRRSLAAVNPPYGSRRDPVTRKVVPHPEESALLLAVVKLVKHGGRGCRLIADMINGDGYDLRGRPWDAEDVRDVVRWVKRGRA